MSITIRDFQPINTWTPDITGPKWQGSEEPCYLKDESTGRSYLNEDEGIVRFKCFLLSLGTPLIQPIALICNIVYRILKLVTFSHFWVADEKEASYNFQARLAEAGKDLLRIVANPLSLIGLELVALYGMMFSPYDARKVYATIERALYTGPIFLAPCFQPKPTRHAFGGDINQKNAF